MPLCWQSLQFFEIQLASGVAYVNTFYTSISEEPHICHLSLAGSSADVWHWGCQEWKGISRVSWGDVTGLLSLKDELCLYLGR